MKTIRCDDCEHYDFAKHVCSRCGRSLPDSCFEFDEMKRKAQAYEEQKVQNNHVTKAPHQEAQDTGVADGSVDSLEAQEPKKPRGRPRKVTL